MRILHVVNIGFTIPYFFGGQIEYFNEKGARIYIACIKDKDFLESIQKYEFIPIYIPILRYVSPFRDLQAVFKLYRQVKLEKIDLVVGHTPKGGIIAGLCAWLSARPFVYIRHGLVYEGLSGFAKYVMLLIEKINYKLSDKTISVSFSLHNKSLFDGISGSKSMVIGEGTANGIDTELFKSKERSLNSKVTFGFIGRITRDKGIYEFLEAIDILESRGNIFRVVIAGPVDTRDKRSQELIDKCQSHPSINYIGQTSEPYSFYSNIDILVLPSYREGFPTVVLEASAMECAVITSRSTGCIDSIEDGVTGIYSDINSEKLADSMEYYIQNPNLILLHGKNGRQQVVRYYDSKRIWNYLYKLYSSYKFET